MSSSSYQSNAPAPAPANLPPPLKVEEKKTPQRRMTLEQIESLIRYKTVHMPEEEAFRKLSLKAKEVLSPEELAYQGKFPVPMGQLDDYIADIFKEINENEAQFMCERDRILNDYYTKGYAMEQEEAASSPPPAVVTKSKRAGKANKMV